MSFHNLPPEIRVQIYKEYFTQEGGYHYNHDTGRLTLADGTPIDLALLSTSRLIAQETRHFPLSLNTVNFSTGCPERVKLASWCIHYLMYDRAIISRLAFEHFGRLLNPEVYETVAQRYPGFTRIMDQMIARPTLMNRPNPLHVFESGAVPSVAEDASQLLLRTALRVHGHSRVADVIYDAWDYHGFPHGYRPSDPFKVLLLDHQEWAMPSKRLANKLAHKLAGVSEFRGHLPNLEFTSRYHNNRNKNRDLKFRYSAAAAAINFLKHMPRNVRIRLRKLRLLEDQPSVHKAAGHGRGLIPFCVENLSLKVERKVSLFGNLLQSHGRHQRQLFHQSVPGVLSAWLVEALALPSAGMPPGSFSLIIDGEPAPDRASEIFQAFMQRPAALQAAFDEASARGYFGKTLSFLRRIHHPCYVLEDFPRAMELLNHKDDLLITSNFHPGDPWDIEQTVLDRQRVDFVTWGCQWTIFPTIGYDHDDEPIIPKDGYGDAEDFTCTPAMGAFEHGILAEERYPMD
ncbi:unnamed protein product [Clonostachys byssicola]|uniref:Uncharacterized protein n=1 Tax=Clonostachys byssicola TaxID=160290 RepID=A0A9N9U0X1_9HYPO|nr:unnamed protein product [Clonostachys byssicola]